MKWLLLLLLGLAFGVAGCGGKKDALILLEELPTVGKIEIHGNEAISDKDIKSVMVLKESSWRFWTRSKLSRFQFEQDQRAILTLYLRRGYPRARIKSAQTTRRQGKRDIILTLDEGESVRVRAVKVDLEPATGEALPFSENSLFRSEVTLRGGDPFDPIQVGNDERRLQRKMAQRGYLLVTSKGNAQFLDNRAFVHYRLDPGDIYSVSAVDISGLREIKRSSLEGFLEVKAGDRFNLNHVNESQRQLMRGGYFLSVRGDTARVDRVHKTLDIVFRVKERKLKWIEGGVGLNSESQVVVNAAWGNRSFARSGLGTVFRERVEFDFSREQPVSRNLVEAIFNKQVIFGSRWAFQPNGFWEYINDQVEVVESEDQRKGIGEYRQNIYGGAAAFRRHIGSDFNQVVISLENRWVYNQADSLAQASDSLLARNFYQTRLIRTSLDLDFRNNFFNPTKGGYMRFVGEFAGGALGGATSFNKFTLGVTRFWPFGETGAIGLRAEIGMAIPSGSHDPDVLDAERVPREDRYAVGGAYSVRGFDERELDGKGQNPGGLSGGTIESLINIEVRWGIIGPVAGVLFVDSGNVWQDRRDFSLERYVPHADPDKVSAKDVRYSYGFGVRLNTPIGPVRMDYARKWNVPRSLGESPDRWHFALGHAF